MSIKLGNTEINTVSMIEPYGDDLNLDFSMEYPEHTKPWVRPSYWLDMPEVVSGVAALIFVPSGNDDFIVGMYARGTGTSTSNVPTHIDIDWGDGHSGLFYGTRSDNSYYAGYFGSLFKKYSFDALPESTQFEHNGWPVRQVVIQVDGSSSGIGYTSVTPLDGHNVGGASRTQTQDNREYYYQDVDGSFVNFQRTGNAYNHQNNRQTSPLLELIVKGPTITGVQIGHESRRYHNCERVELDVAQVNPRYLFYAMHKLQDLTIPSGATAGYSDFLRMFNGCTRLTEAPMLDMSSATSVDSLFAGCINLKTIPLYNTSNVTKFRNMFGRCSSLENIPVFDTSNGTDFEYMFSTCHGLTSIPSGFDFSNGINLNYMFQYNIALQAVPKFDFANVTGIRSMFLDCRNLKSSFEVNAPNLAYWGLNQTFYNCHNINKMDVKDIGGAKDLSSSFQGLVNCKNFKWSDSGCQPINMWQAFAYSYHLTDAPDIDFSQVTGARGCFTYCWNLKNVPVYDFSSMTYTESMFNNCKSLSEIDFKNVLNKCNANSMFNTCENLRRAPSGFFQDYNSTPYYYPSMFANCYYLEDVSAYTISGSTNTSTNNQNLFYQCYRLYNFPQEINTERGCRGMFYRCESATHAGPYDLSPSLDNSSMFNQCYSLRTVDISGINASIGFNDCYLGSGELTKIINNLGTVSATLDIRNNYGAYELHPDTIAIGTNKGWSILT